VNSGTDIVGAGADANAKLEGLRGCKVVPSFSKSGGEWDRSRLS